MKLFLFTVFISCAFADQGASVGTDECTYGPSYWCSHAVNAKKCGAVQHCIDTVWSKQIIQPKQTPECELCVIGITEVKSMLKKNGTSEAIQKFVTEICDKMTSTSYKAECNKFATTELPLLLSLLKSDLSPQAICATIRMCTGFEDTVQHHLKPIVEKPVQTPTKVCNDCENFFTDVQNMVLSNETQEQIEAMLKQTLCAQLGSVQETCNFVVDEFVPQMLQYLGQSVLMRTIDPNTTCRVIGFCNTKHDLFTAFRIRLQHKDLFKKFNKKLIGGSEECDVCKNVMTDVQNLDRDPTIQGKIKDFVETELCNRLGGLKDECNTLVDEYAPVLFQLLANELDPETVCSFVGFCRSVAKPQTPGVSVVHLRKTEPVKALSLLPSLPVKKPVKNAGVECEICKAAIGYLQSVLNKNSTQEQIEKALDEVCDKLPGSLKAQCEDFVKEYGPAVITLIQQEVDPNVICDAAGLCTPLKSEKKVSASIGCVVCEFVMSKLESMAINNKSQVEVKAALDKVCDLMPATISAECTAFVQQYSAMIIQLLVNQVSPKKVCTLIGLCTSSPVILKEPAQSLPKPVGGILLQGAPVLKEQNLPIKTDEECLVCETVLNYLAEALKENATRAAVKSLLNRGCELLPSSLADQCEGLLIAFGDTIINALINEIDPKQLCTDIGICKAKQANKESFKNARLVKEGLKNIMENRNKIDNKLYYKPRHNSINLGQKRCTYGPTYWCKSMDTAKECGMIEHCKNKVWSRR